MYISRGHSLTSLPHAIFFHLCKMLDLYICLLDTIALCICLGFHAVRELIIKDLKNLMNNI